MRGQNNFIKFFKIMKCPNINTKKYIINNGISFPEFSGETTNVYYSNSTGYSENIFQTSSSNFPQYYTINLDWLQFVCTCNNPSSLFSSKGGKSEIYAEKVSVHRNPNFKLLHRIIYYGNEVMEIFSNPNNSAHERNEMQIKITNQLLYQQDWVDTVNTLLNHLGLKFSRLSRVDIALDGEQNLKVIDHFNKFSKSHTVQVGNDALSILPLKFNKHDHRWIGWSVGKSNSGISAKLYHKDEELQESNKSFIRKFWIRNGINPNNVGRFEITLIFKRLKKYNIKNLDVFTDPEFLCSLFENELCPWLRMFSVRKRDMLNHKKEVAIKKGREIRYIKWNRLPNKTQLLPTFDYVTDSTYINARNSISFGLREIRKYPYEQHEENIHVILNYATKYYLQEYLGYKIQQVFGVSPDPIYSGIIDKLSNKSTERPETKI
jgi:hypothetical protein